MSLGSSVVLSVVTFALVGPVGLDGQAVAQYAVGDAVTVNGLTVVVPDPGMEVTSIVEGVGGEVVVLAVSTSTSGKVTVEPSSEPADASGDAAGASSALVPDPQPKCEDDAFHRVPNKHEVPFVWHYRGRTTPRELTKSAAVEALQAAADNMADTHNECGLADEVDVQHVYGGTTKEASDVNDDGTCNAYTENQSVIGFGNPDRYVAAYCVYSRRGEILQADVKLGTRFRWYIDPDRTCDDGFALEGVMTHGFGHAFGLGDVGRRHANLTMSELRYCSNVHTMLGLGDILALRKLY